MSQRLHPRRHFAGVAGMHAVIGRRRREQRRRINRIGFHVLIRRVRHQEAQVAGIGGVAVFVDPRGALQQQVKACHVEQRHFGQHRAEQFRSLDEHHASQQAAIAAATNSELFRCRHARRHQRFCNGDEVIEGNLAFLALCRLMPLRSELAAAANVRDCVQPAAFEPRDARGRVVMRVERDFEATIAVEQAGRGFLTLDVRLTADQPIGNGDAIG